MKVFDRLEAWFVTGSQDLYGPEILKRIQSDAEAIAQGLAIAPEIPVPIVAKPVMTNADGIHRLCLEANNSADCVALIASTQNVLAVCPLHGFDECVHCDRSAPPWPLVHPRSGPLPPGSETFGQFPSPESTRYSDFSHGCGGPSADSLVAWKSTV
jgi:hypothetical protein